MEMLFCGLELRHAGRLWWALVLNLHVLHVA